MFDSAAPAGDGTWWLLDDFPRGWWGATVQLEELQPAGGVGTVIGTNRKTSRGVALVGMCVVASGDKFFEEANALEALLDSMVTADGTLTGAEPTGNKVLTVRYGPGQLLMTRRGNLAANMGGEPVGGFTFAIPLLAANPTKA